MDPRVSTTSNSILMPSAPTMSKKTSKQTTEQNITATKLFVGNLPLDIQESEVESFFAQFLKIEHVYVMRDRKRRKASANAMLKKNFDEQIFTKSINSLLT